MEKQVSFGLMRVREALKEANEVKSFSNAYNVVLDGFDNEYSNIDSRLFFDPSYMNKHRKELRKYFKYAILIFKLAKKYNIYLDRPNDPISAFVFGIANCCL